MTGSTAAPRVLILGGTGMLGHKLWQTLQSRMDAWVTVRDTSPISLFQHPQVIAGVDAERFDSIVRAFETARPGVVINCVGIVKQLERAADPVATIGINALLPHRIAALAHATGARVVQISTDCVFSGDHGGYRESDRPDAVDLYGRTKCLGELSGPGRLTLRSSIIGRQLDSATGLTEWFLSHRGGHVRGYTQARFSGVTTRVLSDVIGHVIEHCPALEGVYHVASEPISKYDLLRKLNEAFDARVAIEPSEDLRIDRSLDGSRFEAATGLVMPSWDAMIRELAADPTPYDDWRHARV